MSTHNNAAGFVAMSPAFEGHFHEQLADLPKSLREFVERDPFLRANWDWLSEDHRQQGVANRDCSDDPANKPAHQAGFYGFDKAAALAGLTALQAARHLLSREDELLDRLGIPCFDVDAPSLAKQLLALDEMRASGADTIHPLAEWLRRAKDKGIEYLPGLDWAVEHCSSLGKRETQRTQEDTPAGGQLENWKMRVQAEAAARWRNQREMGCQPTRHSLKDELAKWCRDNNIRTAHGINPTADYLYRHVLSKRNWKPPTDDSANQANQK